MRTLVIYCLFFMVLFVSCEKEDTRKAVYAGVYDSTFIYHEFGPSFKVNIQWDSLNYYGDGKDSIDLNLDGNYDVIISIHLQNWDAYINSNDPNPKFPYYKLMPKNGFELTSQIESISIHGNSSVSFIWVDTLKYNERIDNISSWSSYETNMWDVTYFDNLFSNGCWFTIKNSEMYIGLRMKNNSRYKYGWIKVNGISRENILFLSFALEK
jgi:hypothetical protein